MLLHSPLSLQSITLWLTAHVMPAHVRYSVPCTVCDAIGAAEPPFDILLPFASETTVPLPLIMLSPIQHSLLGSSRSPLLTLTHLLCCSQQHSTLWFSFRRTPMRLMFARRARLRCHYCSVTLSDLWSPSCSVPLCPPITRPHLQHSTPHRPNLIFISLTLITIEFGYDPGGTKDTSPSTPCVLSNSLNIGQQTPSRPIKPWTIFLKTTTGSNTFLIRVLLLFFQVIFLRSAL